MNQTTEKKFIEAVEICKTLGKVKGMPSNIPCEVIKNLSQVAHQPSDLLYLCNKYVKEIEIALEEVANYAASVDNWKHGDCPFGVKDHCNIISFLLGVHRSKFEFFRGQNWTPEVICEFLKDWQGIDLFPLINQPNQVKIKSGK